MKEMMKTGSRFAHILEKGSGKFIEHPMPRSTMTAGVVDHALY